MIGMYKNNYVLIPNNMVLGVMHRERKPDKIRVDRVVHRKHKTTNIF